MPTMLIFASVDGNLLRLAAAYGSITGLLRLRRPFNRDSRPGRAVRRAGRSFISKDVDPRIDESEYPRDSRSPAELIARPFLAVPLIRESVLSDLF